MQSTSSAPFKDVAFMMRDPRLKKEDVACVGQKEKKTKYSLPKGKALVIMNSVLQYAICLKKPAEFHAFIKEKLMLIHISLTCWVDTE